MGVREDVESTRILGSPDDPPPCSTWDSQPWLGGERKGQGRDLPGMGAQFWLRGLLAMFPGFPTYDIDAQASVLECGCGQQAWAPAASHTARQ